VHNERQWGCQKHACNKQRVVVQRETLHDPLPLAARADEPGNGRRLDVDHPGCLHAGKDDQFYLFQSFAEILSHI
jgi:hypothetical protein